jgi:putative FmdB family regulatory protein
MPIYEYQCTACGARIDKLQKISDAPIIDCPECSSASLKKLVSAASFRLKGSGWYETDFKTSSDKQKNLATSSDHNPAATQKNATSSKGTDKSKTNTTTSKPSKNT